jgi:hypothetical protein
MRKMSIRVSALSSSQGGADPAAPDLRERLQGRCCDFGQVPRQCRVQLGRRRTDPPVKNMGKAGIIEPTKVVRSALQHAASVGSLMITTEAMVAERPEKRAANGVPPGGGMEDMGF